MEFTDFLTSEIGRPKENTIGEKRYCCPFCGEKKYKFYVHEETGQYICFKCERVGNPFTFMKAYFNVSSKGAKDILEGHDIELDNFNIVDYGDDTLTTSERLILMMRGVDTTKKQVSIKPPELPTGFKYLKDNVNNTEAKPFFDYLYSRGITYNQIVNYNIGYIIEGWCWKANKGEKIKLTNSVIFFTYDNEGKYQYWNTRSIEKNPYIKTLNAPGDEYDIGKKDIVFNLNIAKNQSFVIITEGVFDALTFGKYGVATLGKHVSEEQIKLLKLNIDEETSIFIFLDSDTITQNVSLASKLYTTHKNVFVVPHGKQDANDLGVKKAIEIIKNNKILATPEGISRYKLQQKFYK